MKTILIVDDDKDVLNMMSVFMKRFHPDASILCSHHGAHAMEVMKACGNKIDIVVSDIDMPHMDGLHLAAEVRVSFPGTRIILVSGRGEHEVPKDHKAHAVLLKPFELTDLLATIQRLLERP